jgi:PAS domain S-box-containing protein
MHRSSLDNHLERYKLLFENSFEAMVIFDRDGNILEVNQHMADMLGFRVAELIGKNVFAFMLPEEREEAVDRAQKASEGQELPMVERTIMRKDGSTFTGEANLSPIMDEAGHLLYVLGVLRDLTERKQLEEALRLGEERTKALLNASIDIALLTHPDGTIVAGNQACANALGENLDILIGQNVFEYFPADVAEARRERAEQAIKKGKPIHFEDTRDGRWFRNHIYPILDGDGNVDQLAIYAHDITDVQSRAAEEERIRIARELHDSVTQTMYSVSIVAEALPRLLDRNLDEAKRRAVHLRQMTLGALAELRNLLFEFHTKALRDTRLSILVQQLGDVLTGRTHIPVAITIAGDAQPPEDVKIAFYRIAQEAFNNIAKHAQATQVFAVLDSVPNQCKLSIQDNGIGFDLEAVNAEKLGLKIMRERAEEMGADLMVETSPNQGTLVSLLWQPTPAEN